MKIQEGKRYVRRDGEITSELWRTERAEVYIDTKKKISAIFQTEKQLVFLEKLTLYTDLI